MLYYCEHGGVDLMELKPILRTYLPSVHWHCWLGHLTYKNPVPDMTYNVFGGTLNPAQSNPVVITMRCVAAIFYHRPIFHCQHARAVRSQ